MGEDGLPKGSNLITSQVIYEVKRTEDCENSMKARVCPHCNKEKIKDEVGKDSAIAQFDAIILLLAITTFLEMRLDIIDIRGAYRQSGPIRSDIYVRPPREWHGKKGDTSGSFYKFHTESVRQDDHGQQKSKTG